MRNEPLLILTDAVSYWREAQMSKPDNMLARDSTEPLVDNLWNEAVIPDKYGSKEQYYQHIFEQYKICVEMADRISERRNAANTFFLTLHTLLIGVASFTYEKGPKITNQWLNIFPLITALTLCYVWWRLIKSYRQLNTAKYKVIGEYERKLPSSPYWLAEWTVLGKGNDPNLYKPLTDVEYWIPVIFGCVYILMAISTTI